MRRQTRLFRRTAAVLMMLAVVPFGYFAFDRLVLGNRSITFVGKVTDAAGNSVDGVLVVAGVENACVDVPIPWAPSRQKSTTYKVRSDSSCRDAIREDFGEPPGLVKRVVERRRGGADDVGFAEVADGAGFFQ